SGGSTGILVFNGGHLSGGVDNSGTIKGSRSFGISGIFGSDITGDIINRAGGTISGPGAGIWIRTSTLSGQSDNGATITGGTGILIATNALASGGITNRAGGAISGSGATGIAVVSGSTVSNIGNSGTIHGGSFGINVQQNSDITSGITNDGT